MRFQAHDLRRRLYITFKGEEGLDYGGVARYTVLLTLKNLIIFLFNQTLLVLSKRKHFVWISLFYYSLDLTKF